MGGILFRTVLAIIACVLLFVLLPAVFRVIGVPLTADVWLILRICIAGMALLYIAWGRSQPPGF